MPYNPKIHRRRSIRLPNYDYSRSGAYFVTICVQGRSCLFGHVMDGEMRLNDAGVMLNRWYNELMRKFDDIACDAWVCMPNHVHFIVINTGHACPHNDSVGADLRVRPAHFLHIATNIRAAGDTVVSVFFSVASACPWQNLS